MRALVALIVLAAATAPPTSALPDPAGGAASIGPPSDARLATIGYGADGVEAWRGRVEPVSWAPRAVVLHGFLTAAECDHLIAKAKPRMEVSTVVDNDSGQSMPSKVRTSTGTFFELGEDPVIEAIERRIALVTNLPVDNGEGLQILRYVDGQKYEPHHDFFHDDFNTKAENGGQRIGERGEGDRRGG
jgi:prolyl 4-hydroxylase